MENINKRSIHFIYWEVGLFIATVFIWFIGKKIVNLIVPDDYLIDVISIIGLVVVFINRSPSPRFFWYGWLGLCATALSSVFQFGTLVYFLSSFSFVFLALGAINMLVFEREEKKKVSV